MRRLFYVFMVFCLMAAAPVVMAGEGKVIKALPQFLDSRGRQALYPSLFERDAYQRYLREHPQDQSALRVAVQWKAKNVNWDKVKLRVELRSAIGNSLHTSTLEEPVKKTGWFSSWTNVEISGEAFKQLGEVSAWRVTLWDGDQQLSELKSFLW